MTGLVTVLFCSFQDLVNQNDPKELLSADEYQELKLEIFTERKISTEVIADIKLTEEEIQAIRKKTNERRQAVHSKTEKEIADRWTFEEGVRQIPINILLFFSQRSARVLTIFHDRRSSGRIST